MVFPLSAFKTSPGLYALPPGMFSVVGMIPCTSTRGWVLANWLNTPKTAAAPDISIFMVSMPEAGFKDNPPRIKGDSFAHDGQGFIWFPGGFVMEVDQIGLLGASPVHAQQTTRAHPHQFFFSVDFETYFFIRHFFCRIRQYFGGHVTGCPVDEVAGQDRARPKSLGLGQHLPDFGFSFPFGLQINLLKA